MNYDTGEIYETDELVRKAIKNGVDPKKIVRIPAEHANEVVEMNRQQRRAWYSRNHKRLGLQSWAAFNGGGEKDDTGLVPDKNTA